MPENCAESTSFSSSECGTKASPSVDLAVGRDDDGLDGQLEALRERVVALVVGGHGHDRAGAVLHEHVVGDPDREPVVVDRVRDEAPGGDAGLLLLGVGALGSRAACRVAHVVQHLLLVRRPLARRRTSGCSGARTKNVAPKSVSGRVVKTGMSMSSSSIRKTTSAPSERPIQFRCIVRTRSGQDSSSAMSSRSRSA